MIYFIILLKNKEFQCHLLTPVQFNLSSPQKGHTFSVSVSNWVMDFQTRLGRSMASAPSSFLWQTKSRI